MELEGINFVLGTNNEEEISDSNEGLDFTGISPISQSIIKVIGVGGGGGNAINHMYNKGVHDVTYVVCNTDSKALQDSPVPVKLQLGEGLGAGNIPAIAKKAAESSKDDILSMLDPENTRMVFITAGMGGGTGTGAAPIIAECAKNAGILTIGIVTIPFFWEGIEKINQALDGVEEMSKHVDAMLVINNERLRTIYSDLTLINAFAKADDILLIAVRSIVDIINMHGRMGVDFQDVSTTLKDGGVAVMGIGYGEGENRVTKAINEALDSPLLNNNNIFNSKYVLLKIDFSDEEEHNGGMGMGEMAEIHKFMTRFAPNVKTKWGIEINPSLQDKIKITILASGFGLTNVPILKEVLEVKDTERERTIGELYDDYNKDPKNPSKKRMHLFIFQPDEMDDDEVIASVCSSPTCNRKPGEVPHIRKHPS